MMNQFLYVDRIKFYKKRKTETPALTFSREKYSACVLTFPFKVWNYVLWCCSATVITNVQFH